MAVDHTTCVYVADYTRIQKFTPSGTFLRVFQGAGQLFGVAVDSRGFVYASEVNAGQIVKFASSGTLLQRWPTAAYPSDLAVDAADNVYVSHSPGTTIQKYTSAGELLRTYSSGFQETGGICLDSNGNIWLTDRRANSVRKLASDGTIIPTSFAHQFSTPQAVAVSADGNTLYVAEYTATPHFHKFRLAEPLGVDLALHGVSRIDGAPNTDAPGSAQSVFKRGETVRVTLKADTTGPSVNVRVVLNLIGPDGMTVLYDSHDPSTTSSHRVEDNSTGNPLRPGHGSNYYSFDWTLPANPTSTPLGDYALVASIRDVAVWETVYDTTSPGRSSDWSASATLRNVFRLVQGVPAHPADLLVEQVCFEPHSIEQGGGLTLSALVRNLGAEATGATEARMLVTMEGFITGNEPPLSPAEVEVPPISPGGTYSLQTRVTVPPSVFPGSYFVGVIVDPNREQMQSDFNNDIAVSAARLVVAASGPPGFAVEPSAVTVSAARDVTSLAIRNTGSGLLEWAASITTGSWLDLDCTSSGLIPEGGIMYIRVAYQRNFAGPRVGIIHISAPAASPSAIDVHLLQNAPTAAERLTAFHFSPVSSPQQVGHEFVAQIRAMSGDAQASSFTGRVKLEADTGAQLAPSSECLLENGVGEARVSLDVPGRTRLRAYLPTPGAVPSVFGQSAAFDLKTDKTASLWVQLQLRGLLLPVTATAVDVFAQEDGNPIPVVSRYDPWKQRALFGNLPFGHYTIWCDYEDFSHTHYRGWIRVPVVSSRTMDLRLARRGAQPVLFVPGYGGSTIGGIWPDRPYLPKQYPAEATVLGLLNTSDAVGWNRLEGTLPEREYACYPVPWDWRMPGVGAEGFDYVAWREYLLPAIERAKEETGSAKVQIVAHSTGGLLARAYIQSSQYASDVDRLALVAVPNEGCSKAYYAWWGGHPRRIDEYDKELGDCDWPQCWFFDNAASELYRTMEGREWHVDDRTENATFIRFRCVSLGDLLPTFPYLRMADGQVCKEAWVDDRPLSRLNRSAASADVYADEDGGPDKVRTKVFLSRSERTITRVSVDPPRGGLLYPLGEPRDSPESPTQGDGLAWMNAVLFAADEVRAPEYTTRFAEGKHGELVKLCAGEIASFLGAGKSNGPGARPSPGSVTLASPRPEYLTLIIRGKAEPFLIAPDMNGLGVRPEDGELALGISGGSCSINSAASELLVPQPEPGDYDCIVRGSPGSEIIVDAGLFSEANHDFLQAQWILGENPLRFRVRVTPTAGEPVWIAPLVSAPLNVRIGGAGGTAVLTWSGVTNVAGVHYLVHGRIAGDSTFSLLGTVSQTMFDTGHAWAPSDGTIWTYAVVAEDDEGSRSTFTTILENRDVVMAGFSSDVRTGVVPLTVRFTDRSVGEITSWAWDFNEDGNVDSIERNPTCTFIEPGNFTVSLFVAGPLGSDRCTASAFVVTGRPTFESVAVQPDGSLQLGLTTQPGRAYAIAASTDLATWSTFAEFVSTNAVMFLVDERVVGSPQRFYRAVMR